MGFYADAGGNRFDGEMNVTAARRLPISEQKAISSLIFVFEDDIVIPDDETEEGPEEPQEPEEPEQPEQQEQPEHGEDQSIDDEPPASEPEASQQPAQQDEPSGTVTSEPAIYRPGRSAAPSSDDAEEQEPETGPEPTPPALTCGGAVLDTSNRAYLMGYGDGVIGEDDFITRAQIAQVIYRLMTEESREALNATENSFEDVPTSAWYSLPVSTIARAGIVVGYGDRFHPEAYLTRAQLITIMARFIEPVERESGFYDVSGHWAETFISTAEASGWLTGGGALQTDEYVTRGEVVSFINHAFDVWEDNG